MKRFDVVVTTAEDTYTDSVRRGFYSTADQTLLSLVASPAVRRILFVDAPRGALSQVRRRTQGDHPAPNSGKLRGIRPLKTRTTIPSDARGLAAYYRGYARQIMWGAAWHGLVDPVVVDFNIFSAATPMPGMRRRLFYAQDDNAGFDHSEEWRATIRGAYAAVDRSDTHVVAVSHHLLDAIAPLHGGTVIPNGIEAELWNNHTASPEPSDSLASPDSPDRPRVVYVGTVDSRLDLAAVASVGAAGFAVQMVGMVADAEVGAALERMPNVQVLGARTREEVVTLTKDADVCLLAHVSTELTRSMSPLKLFEYAASGVPVVATALPGVVETGLDVELVPPGGDYVAATHRALARGRMSEPERRDVVRRLSWRARHEVLLDLVTDGVTGGARETVSPAATPASPLPGATSSRGPSAAAPVQGFSRR